MISFKKLKIIKTVTKIKKKDYWIIDALNYANISLKQINMLSKITFKTIDEEGAYWDPNDSSINIGIKSNNLINKNFIIWKNQNNQFKKEMIHKVCHELTHFYLSTKKINFFQRKFFFRNHPHHRSFYKKFKKICPKKYQYLEYFYYPEYAKIENIPYELNNNKLRGIFNFLYYSAAILCGLFLQFSFF